MDVLQIEMTFTQKQFWLPFNMLSMPLMILNMFVQQFFLETLPQGIRVILVTSLL